MAGKPRSGVLAWFARNGVAANVMMIVLIVGGLIMSTRVKQEVFPEIDLDMVMVQVMYPGASPEEVEKGVILAVEEAVRGLDDVKHVRSLASEGSAVVTVELLESADPDRSLSDVESAIGRITSFPADTEEPVVFLASTRQRVVSLVVYGDVDEVALRKHAEAVRNELLTDPRVTYIELGGARPLEVSVDVPREQLRRYGLTLEGIAARIKQASVELPGGAVKTEGGEVLVRTAERRDTAEEFGDIVLLSRPDGTAVKVADIATVRDGFAETDQEAFFNGKRALTVDVFRVGDQTPIEVSDAVMAYIAEHEKDLPAGLQYATWFDTSEMYKDRRDLMLKNAAYGLVLVLLVLGLFLEVKLAFWVTMGIPISFIGAMVFLPATDVSLNMISLFAFIVTLGMVVDDAIVVGEAVYTRRTQGAGRLEAAIEGVKEVAVPVTFAIVTTVVAFSPLLFVPGMMGKFFKVVPIVVIAVLLLSLFESLLILPAHLAHSKETEDRGVFGWIHHQQQRFSRLVEWFIERTYAPSLAAAVRNRFVTLAAALALFIGSVGLVAGGRVEFEFFPRVEGDLVIANLELQFGANVDETRKRADQLLAAAHRVIERHGGQAALTRGIFTQVGDQNMSRRMGPPTGATAGGTHLAEISVYLVPTDQRGITAEQFANEWRAELGEVPGIQSLKFISDTAVSPGAPIDFELSHSDMGTLERAAERLGERLASYDGVTDIDSGYRPGKDQIDFKMKPEGISRGLTAMDLGRQVRSAFFGAEALRQQRGRDELRVYVRLPREERGSEYYLEQLLVRTPAGGEMPLGQAASVVRNKSYTSIRRTDGRRTLNVTAEIDPTVTNANKVMASVMAEVIPELKQEFRGLKQGLGGQQQQQQETMAGLGLGFIIALVVMFGLLAIAFRSYIQPVIIMGVIPFGFVGAIVGHVLMGYNLSLMSMMGVVALAGVVVNDSLILIVAINEYRAEGLSPYEAIMAGGTRRFRPILLTSLTTFFGLMPMILETSMQARFMIPMAISLGFGVMFATFITLLLVPSLYLVLEDLKALFGIGGVRAAPAPVVHES